MSGYALTMDSKDKDLQGLVYKLASIVLYEAMRRLLVITHSKTQNVE